MWAGDLHILSCEKKLFKNNLSSPISQPSMGRVEYVHRQMTLFNYFYIGNDEASKSVSTWSNSYCNYLFHNWNFISTARLSLLGFNLSHTSASYNHKTRVHTHPLWVTMPAFPYSVRKIGQFPHGFHSRVRGQGKVGPPKIYLYQ